MIEVLKQRLREMFGGNWKPVPSLEEKYFVSDAGLVYSVPRKRARGGIRKTSYVYGYERISIHEKTRLVSRNPLVHQLVMLAFVGESNGKDVRHLDGDKKNNRLENLAYGTKRENEQDKARHGTRLRGERTPSAKLSWDQVCFIRCSHGKIPQKRLAEMHKVHKSTIQRIQYGLVWEEKC